MVSVHTLLTLKRIISARNRDPLVIIRSLQALPKTIRKIFGIKFSEYHLETPRQFFRRSEFRGFLEVKKTPSKVDLKLTKAANDLLMMVTDYFSILHKGDISYTKNRLIDLYTIIEQTDLVKLDFKYFAIMEGMAIRNMAHQVYDYLEENYLPVLNNNQKMKEMLRDLDSKFNWNRNKHFICFLVDRKNKEKEKNVENKNIVSTYLNKITPKYMEKMMEVQSVYYLEEYGLKEPSAIKLTDLGNDYLRLFTSLFLTDFTVLHLPSRVDVFLDTNILVLNNEMKTKHIIDALRTEKSIILNNCANYLLSGYISAISIPVLLNLMLKVEEISKQDIKKYITIYIRDSLYTIPFSKRILKQALIPAQFNAVYFPKAPSKLDIFTYEVEDFIQYISFKSIINRIMNKKYQYLITENIKDFIDVQRIDKDIKATTPLSFLLKFLKYRIEHECNIIPKDINCECSISLKLDKLTKRERKQMFMGLVYIFLILKTLNDSLVDRELFMKTYELNLTKIDITIQVYHSKGRRNVVVDRIIAIEYKDIGSDKNRNTIQCILKTSIQGVIDCFPMPKPYRALIVERYLSKDKTEFPVRLDIRSIGG
ncbi:MAG: hypothetical protein GF364_01630 [Candidatus Lokiarchaeota archaeon]|nr:hypothetical protein [Candidatus Lokiarchaeota archaeon]